MCFTKNGWKYYATILLYFTIFSNIGLLSSWCKVPGIPNKYVQDPHEGLDSINHISFNTQQKIATLLEYNMFNKSLLWLIR